MNFRKWEFVPEWRAKMKTCRECGEEFAPVKGWQDFCCERHRQSWHYRQRKRADVEAAEMARARRMNGHGASEAREEKIDLAALVAREPEQIKRRRIA
jgi:hypothetical protein